MNVQETHGSRNAGLWRSRWAAIGAAVAVTFGGGGVLWAHADGAPTDAPAIESFVEARIMSGTSQTALPAKKVTPVDPSDLAQPTPSGDAQFLSTGATFFPITPYRAFDSRSYSDGLLIWGDGVYFDVITDENGNPRIPASAVAVTYNLTITGTFGSYGYLSVFPGGAPEPNSSSINWFAPGLDLANGGVVSLGNIDGPGEIVVLAGAVPDTATDFIIDITGYYE